MDYAKRGLGLRSEALGSQTFHSGKGSSLRCIHVIHYPHPACPERQKNSFTSSGRINNQKLSLQCAGFATMFCKSAKRLAEAVLPAVIGHLTDILCGLIDKMTM